MGLLADDHKWMRPLDDCFSSTLSPYISAWGAILALCKPSNPLRIRNESREKFLIDFPKKNKSFGNDTDLEIGSVAEHFAPNELQKESRGITGNFESEQFGLPKIPSEFFFIAFDESLNLWDDC